MPRRTGIACLIVAVLAPSAPLAQAPARLCRVADPSPTPTNLRAAPAGTVIGTIANGTLVEIAVEADGGGRPWALVVRPGAATLAGWVARSLVACG